MSHEIADTARWHAGQPRVLTFTSLYPNTQQPSLGLFVRERVQALARLCELTVVAPVPWAPPARWLGDRYYRYSQVPARELQGRIHVWHPRFAVIPKVFKTLDWILMAAGSRDTVQAVRQSFPYQVIDAHWAYPDGVAAAVLARQARLPLAITVRGDDINVFAESPARRPLLRWSLSRAGVVVALSDELKRRVVSLGVPADKVVVVPNGVDPQRFSPVDRKVARQRLGLPTSVPLLVSVGRLHVSKGFPLLVQALARLSASVPGLELAIIGDPDPEADARPLIESTARALGVSDRIRLVGGQPPDRLADWYSAADVFCLATLREGSANVLLEALACGTPCVTTPVGGNPDVIRPEAGILAPGEVGAFAAAIATALNRSWDRALIAARGRCRSWDDVAAECWDALARIAGLTARRAA